MPPSRLLGSAASPAGPAARHARRWACAGDGKAPIGLRQEGSGWRPAHRLRPGGPLSPAIGRLQRPGAAYWGGTAVARGRGTTWSRWRAYGPPWRPWTPTT